MRRLLIFLLIIAAIIGSIAFLFPMRLAVSLANLEAHGFAAREVNGSIWSGRFEDAQYRGLSLGNLEAGLDATSLLSDPMVAVARDTGDGGRFTARIGGSAERFILRDGAGAVPIRALSGRLPFSTAILQDGNMEFADGRCINASGKVEVVPSGLLSRLLSGEGLRGDLVCQDNNLGVTMQGPTGNERLNLTVDPQGRYQLSFAITGLAPELRLGLRTFGFEPSGDAMVYRRAGTLN